LLPGNRKLVRCLAAAVLGAALVSTARAAPEYSFGVVPQYSPVATAERWQPLIERLARDAGLALRFATAMSISEFESRLLAGSYDFAYSNPLHFREARRARGYRPLVRDVQPLTGILVARAGAAATPAALAGAAIAFPSPRALGATLLVRNDLKRLGIGHEVIYVGTHESVYQSVRQGQIAAGGGVRRTFELLPDSARRELRIIHETSPVASHVIAAHPRVAATEVKRLRDALKRLHGDAAGRALLKHLGMQQLVAARPGDFAALAALKPPPRLRQIAMHVPPRADTDSMRRMMQPVAVALRQRLELDTELRVYGDLDGFERAIYAEKDAALINANPLQALRLMERGFEVIVEQQPGSGGGTRSVFLVRNDSPFRSLGELAGRRIAFGGDEKAFFGSLLPKTMLRRAGLAHRYTEVRLAGAAVTEVLSLLENARADAVAVSSAALAMPQLRERDIEGRLRVLAASEPLPGLAWLVGPRLHPDQRDEIRGVLLGIGPDSPVYNALREAGIGRLAPANNATYAPVRAFLANNRP
jgi:phosphonate transport system substrate-binding protein